MDPDKDVIIQRLKSKVHELEVENSRYKNYADLARKYEFRIMGAVLLIIGVVISVIAYPSYAYSNIATLLLMTGIGSMFIGTVTLFLNTERFTNQKIAEHLNLSSVIVVDALLRDLRLKNKGVYVPSSKAGGLIKVFIPLKKMYEMPPESKLKEEGAFVINLPNAAQEGVLLPPLGYHLFKYTQEELKVGWQELHREQNSVEESPSEGAREKKLLVEKLREVFVKGLEIADAVVASENDEELRVRLQNTSYAEMCKLLSAEAPQVCEQIGCPLCSLVACIYTERTDAEVIIESAQSDGNDITVVCKAH